MGRVVRVWLAAMAVAVAWPLGTAWAQPAEPAEARFFLAGRGVLAVHNAHTGERVRVTYRLIDGTYEPGAFSQLQRVFRSRGDGREGTLEPRFVEVLGWLYDATDRRPLQLLSGYRSPEYNDTIRERGAKAASASLHTEGMAADFAFPRAGLKDLWLRLRDLDCCGVGFYEKGGFMHVDVGPPRFWEEATSGVDKNLSAENARLFGRTDFDRYAPGDAAVVSLHSMTLPPVRLRAAVAVEGAEATARIAEPAPDADGCVETDARTRLLITDLPATTKAALLLTPCDRPGATPETIRTNPIAVTPGDRP
jgi:uncharacterized protein YcbK (DUF882 family)